VTVHAAEGGESSAAANEPDCSGPADIGAFWEDSEVGSARIGGVSADPLSVLYDHTVVLSCVSTVPGRPMHAVICSAFIPLMVLRAAVTVGAALLEQAMSASPIRLTTQGFLILSISLVPSRKTPRLPA